MPITISYDLRTENEGNHRTYIRSMFERFGWKRLGGSVFRYPDPDQQDYEDWLNDVVPALMFFRSYVLRHGIQVRFFTIDASGISYIDFSDPEATYGYQPDNGVDILLSTPTNNQSSAKRIKRFIDAAIDVLPGPQEADDDDDEEE